ncbi:hypothetical protein K7432_007729 [Basidiobolus ranarum]|uniref:Uncharacterized protein n=1 Tax=Basidiobolus ranarum TaxID=34480 RepID=A0ABR2WSV1_9FUNG
MVKYLIIILFLALLSTTMMLLNSTKLSENGTSFLGSICTKLDASNSSTLPNPEESLHYKEIHLKNLLHMFPKDTNYLIHNWPAFLGFNNVRYMIEHAYYYAYVLNRTVVLPDRVHCRSCLHEGFCHLMGAPADDSKTMDSPAGRDGKDRWSVPIEEFIDMNRMVERSEGTVIRMQDFLRVQLYYQDLQKQQSNHTESTPSGDLDNELIEYWNPIDPVVYLSKERGITFQDCSAQNFTLAFPELTYGQTNELNKVCFEQESMDDLEPIMRQEMKPNSTSIEVYGYSEEPNYSVREFKQKIIPLSDIPKLRGFKQSFGFSVFPQQLLHVTSRYFHRFPRRPFYFTTKEGREKYDNFALNILAPPLKVIKASEHLYANLQRKLSEMGVESLEQNVTMSGSGKHVMLGSYIGFHGRRGDFIRYNWVNNLATPDAWQNAMIKMIEHVKTDKKLSVFYLASDENSSEALEKLYEHNMIRVYDLMDSEFLHEYGDLAAFGDWLALLDQRIMAKSKFFIGTWLSSVTGGVLNYRKSAGVDDTREMRNWMRDVLKEVNMAL